MLFPSLNGWARSGGWQKCKENNQWIHYPVEALCLKVIWPHKLQPCWQSQQRPRTNGHGNWITPFSLSPFWTGLRHRGVWVWESLCCCYIFSMYNQRASVFRASKPLHFMDTKFTHTQIEVNKMTLCNYLNKFSYDSPIKYVKFVCMPACV